MARYTCNSPTYGSCGAKHTSIEDARSCAKFHSDTFDEHRTPQVFYSVSEFERFPLSPRVTFRRERWAERVGATKRTLYVPEAYFGRVVAPTLKRWREAEESYANTCDGRAPAKVLPPEPLASEPEPTPEPTPAVTPQQVIDDAARRSASHVGNPLAPMADALAPLMVDRIKSDLEQALTTLVAETVDPVRVDKALSDMTERVDEAISKLGAARPVQIHGPRTVDPTGVSGPQHPKYEVLCKVIGCETNSLLVGRPGSGKTEGARRAAQAMGYKLFIQPLTLEKFEVYGFIDAGGKYHESEVYKWATCEEPAVLLLDEIDGWDPTALISMNALLANGIGTFPVGEVVVPVTHLTIGTANTRMKGATSEFTGRQRQDGASRDRLPATIDWEYDEAFECEIVASDYGTDLVPVAKQCQRIRANLDRHGIKIEWTPRQTFAVCSWVASGNFSFEEALRISNLSDCDPTQWDRATEKVTMNLSVAVSA